MQINNYSQLKQTLQEQLSLEKRKYPLSDREEMLAGTLLALLDVLIEKEN